MNEQVHRLLLEQRKTLSLGGVQDVKSFDENEVLLVTVCGVLTIRGKELHVGRLELEKGEADIEGSIDSLVYTEHGPLQKKGLRLRGCSVKMSAYVTRELILLACSIWQGAVLGFWYDLIKTARKLIRHSHAAVSARRTSATGLRQRCICLYGFTERTAAFSVGICLAASLGALHCTTHRLDAFFRNFWQRESKSRANPRFSRKMAGKKYEKTEKKVEISWEER